MPWPAKLAAYFGFLVSAVLLTSLQLLVPSVDGYITSGVTLGVIVTLFILLRTNSRSFSEMWALIVGPGTGTTDANSYPSNIDSLLSRFTAILAENGQSWLQASDHLRELEYQLRRIEATCGRILVQSSGERNDDDEDEGIEEAGEDSE